MKLRLFFTLPNIGDVEIHTDSGHGSYDKLIVNRQDLTEDGDVIDMVSQAIGQEKYLFAIYSAQYEKGGVFRDRESA